VTWLALFLAAAPGLDGSVVDKRTDRGIEAVEVSIYSWASGAPELAAKLSTEVGGGFEVPEELRGPFSASLFDPATQTPLGSVPAAGRLEALPDPWRLEVDLGPTVPFQFSDATQDVRQWRLRLVERDESGRERVWPWRAAQVGDPAWIRYPRYEYEPETSYSAFLEAQVRDRTMRATGRVGEDGGVTRLSVFQLGAITGRARFEDSAEAAPGIAVRAVPLDRPGDWDDPSSWAAARTTTAGDFAVAGLEAGRYLLCAEKDGTPLGRAEVSVDGPTAVDLTLRGGPCELRVAIDGTGEPGWLTLYGGPDTPRAATPLRDDLFTFVQRLPARPGPESRVRFDALAAGFYTVAFQDCRGGPEVRRDFQVRRPPTGFSGSGPAQPEVETIRLSVDAPASHSSTFEVRASDGRTLAETHLQTWTDSLWFPELLPSLEIGFGAEDFHWAASAPGYRPVFGHAREPGTFTATLEPGWGVRLCVRSVDHLEFPSPADWSTYVHSHSKAPALSGVRVVVDGVEAGATDESGELWIEGAEAPGEIALELGDMAVVASPLFRAGRVLGTSAEVVVWMRSTSGR